MIFCEIAVDALFIRIIFNEFFIDNLHMEMRIPTPILRTFGGDANNFSFLTKLTNLKMNCMFKMAVDDVKRSINYMKIARKPLTLVNGCPQQSYDFAGTQEKSLLLFANGIFLANFLS